MASREKRRLAADLRRGKRIRAGALRTIFLRADVLAVVRQLVTLRLGDGWAPLRPTAALRECRPGEGRHPAVEARDPLRALPGVRERWARAARNVAAAPQRREAAAPTGRDR